MSAFGRPPSDELCRRLLMTSPHSIVLFAGDFNYRIDLPNDEARALAIEANVPRLLQADQLLRVMREGAAFGGYAEGSISFLYVLSGTFLVACH